MKIKKILCLALVGTMIFSTPVIAAENNPDRSTLETNEWPVAKEGEDADEIAVWNDELKSSLKSSESSDFDDVIVDNSVTTTYAGDIYEANNGPAVATTGRYNKVTSATIHEATDVDWYKIEVFDASEPISVLLTNIPIGCDYDMFLVQYSNGQLTKMYQNVKTGNTSEELVGNVDQAGTYYVVIQPNTTAANNFSTSPYQLYVGKYWLTGQYGYVDTGWDINFGYVPVGNEVTVSKGWYSYNLSNNFEIPDKSIVNKIYLTDSGNGAYWIGFYKVMAAEGQNVRLQDKIGQIELMYSGDNQLWAKQNWLIGGYLLASTNFVWEPKILIGYKFPAVIENFRFL